MVKKKLLHLEMESATAEREALQGHVHNVTTSDLASDQTEPKTFSNEIKGFG